MGVDAGLIAAARAWLAEDPDPATRAELAAVIDAADSGDAAAVEELADAFAATLQFGTAGLRGRIGPGPNRMNRTVVTRAAAGLAAYLVERGGGAVVIGYDARRDSDVYARDTAEVMAGAGLAAMVLPRPLPTPVLAYAIRQLGCAAGVMVTASHNPPRDNGYKVYLGDGRQIVPPADAQIAERIAAVGPLAGVARGDGWVTLDDAVLDDYLTRVTSIVAPDGPRDVTVAYTPMHGVGGTVFLAAMARAGFPEPVVVREQFDPDPTFRTVAFPNPEEPGALDLAFATATAAGADVIVANDPDADRCAVAVPGTDGGWRMLHGDELGAVLAWWLVERGRAAGRPLTGTMAESIVSGSLLARIADAAGLAHVETLTGFKWISRAPGLVFGYEEALGYCVDPAAVSDKDGVSAGLLAVELVASLRSQGRTVLDVLDDLARAHGAHVSGQLSIRVADLSLIAAAMARLRADPPRMLGGATVEQVEDLSRGSATLPATDGLRFTLAEGARLIVRPSGTEPKLKCYLQAVVPVGGDGDPGPARAEGRRRIDAIIADLRPLVS